MANNLINISTNTQFHTLEQKQSFFLNNYEDIIVSYIADGNPSKDTLAAYYSSIKNFLTWCKYNALNPLAVTENHMIVYRSFLIDNEYAASSISANLAALRIFFFAVVKLGLLGTNPVEDIKAPRNRNYNLDDIPYIPAGKLEYLFQLMPLDSEKNLRDKVIIALMAIEGLRTVEIHRMNEEDIDSARKVIYIRGKGKNALIYLRSDTFDLLQKYLQYKDREKINYTENEELTPVFTSLSNNDRGHRMNRRSIRRTIDGWLTKAGLKEKNKSGHMLRHTCATLLYKETRDIKAIQETLRHSSINTSSKYAHLVDREDNRYTVSIPVEL